MRVAVLFTGGKDSTLALYQAIKEGHKVKCLVSMFPRREDSWMFHYPNIHMVKLLAASTEIPLITSQTSGIKEKEVNDLYTLIEKLEVDGLVSGAISSNYQKTRIDKICSKLGLTSITPLWHEEELKILQKILKLEFSVIITGVYAYGFNESWLGRSLTETTVDDLKKLKQSYGISLVGEGGEYESLVLDAPLLKSSIEIVTAEKIWDGQSGHLLIKNAVLKEKR